MPNDRIASCRRGFQKQMELANSRICKNGRELQKAFKSWVDAAHKDGLWAFLAQLADCYGRLVQRTPVDTGRARAGWHIEGRLDEWKPDAKEYENAKNEIAGLIAQEIDKLEDLSRADVVYIMNNVEYILPLEAGWSKQSSGFWALFLSELSSQLELAAQRSKRGNP